MRKISMLMIATVFLLLSSIHAQTALNPGDLVIVTANADGSDNFDFIPLVDIQVGTVIKFTDNAWTTADTLRTNEGTVTWTASANVAKGTVVSYTGATAGDWVKGTGFDIAAAGDNILVYQGDATTPSFIYGIGWAKANNWIWTGNNDSDIPDALSVASKTIVQLANFDDNQYNGSTSGTVAQLLAMVAYAPYWVGNDATAYTAYPNAFTITATATCTAPYALTATGITSSSANLGWSTFGTEVLWNVEYGVTGFVQGAGTTVSGVTNPYTLNGLTQNTTYQFYVQADCGGSTSTWAGPFSFTTPYSCPKPTLTTVANITATSAVLGWTNGGTETAWIVYYKTAAATDYTEVTGVTTNPYTLGGLTANTNYIFKVKANCSVSDTSFVSVIKTFSTIQVPASIPYTEGFETWPNNWTVVNGTQVNKWAVSTAVANTGTQSAYVSNDNGTTNAYTTSSTSCVHMYRDITFPAGVNPFNLKFNWKGQGEGTTTKYDYLRVFLVPITTTPVSGTELTGQLGTYNLQSTWQTVNLTLANATYANQTWRLVVSWNNDSGTGAQPPIAIDDIVITELSCVPPTALAATSITAASATLGWTAGGTETLWNVEYGVTGFVQGAGTTVTGVTNPYTLNGLAQNTTYQYYVKSDCGGSGTSTWAGPFSFTTPYSCPKPTLPTAENITTSSAQLGWTNGGTETAWIVYYKTAAATDYTEVTGVTTNPYTLNGLSVATNYIFKVKANCSVLDTSYVSATKTFTTPCNAVSTLPWSESFESGYIDASAIAGCWSQVSTTGPAVWNANSTATSYNRTPRTGTFNATLYYSNEDWLFYPFNLSAGTSYTFEMYARQDGSTLTDANIIVAYGANPNLASMTNPIVPLTGLTSGNYQLITAAFTPATTGVFYIGIKGAINSAPYYISIDDIKLSLTPSCIAPTALAATAISSTGATLGWTAGGTETLWNVEYGITGFTRGTGTLITANTNSKVLTSLSANTTYQFYVQSNCGGGPADTSSCVGPISFTTLCNSVSLFPYVEDFEGLSLPSCWIETKTPASTYGWTSYSTGYAGRGLRFDSYSNAMSNVSMLKTPVLNISSLATAQVDFWWKNPTGGAFVVKLSTDGGVTFPNTIATSMTAQSTWAQKTINISSYISSGSNVVIGFEGTSNWGSNDAYVYLDKLTIGAIPSCLSPTALAATAISSTGATLGWTAGGTETLWNVEYGVTGFTRGTGTLITANTNSKVLTTLSANTTYQFYVQSNCGGGPADTSSCVGPISFTTLCNSVSLFPYVEDFEGLSLPSCWIETKTPASTYGWTSYATGYAGRGLRFDSYNNATSNVSMLKTPVLNISSLATAQVDFWWKNPTGGDFVVKLSTDGGVTFPNTIATSMTAQSTWAQKTINISSYISSGSNVVIGFEGTSNYGNGDAYVYIDKLTIGAIPSCLTPTNLTARTITKNSATLDWTAGATETAWKVEYGVTGFAHGAGTTVITNIDTLAISSLSPATSYQYYVQANCGSLTDTSSWAGPFPFTTLIACYVPTALTASITATSATLGWTAGGTETSWDVEYGLTGFIAGAGTTTTVSANTLLVNGLTANTSYQFYVKANCGGADGSSVPSSRFSFFTGYCTPAPSSVDGSGITNVTFSTVNNTTTTETGNYGNYTSMVGNVQQTATIPVAITFATGYTYDTKIWIDWNDDLDFTDAGENVYTGTSLASNPTTLNASFTVPLTASLGNHRMRIGGQDSGPATPCYSGTYGSYEDYTVNVIPAPACVIPNTLTATAITATGATLGWTAGNSEIAWNVKYRVTGPNSFTVATANSTSLVVNGLTQNTTYEFYVQSSCGSVTDTSAWAGPFPFTTPYSCPKPTALNVVSSTTSSAILGWTAGGTETSWILYYKEATAANYTEVLNVNSNPYTLNGLNSATNYIFKVKANCSVSDTSVVSVTQTFTTSCNAISSFPYLESFNGTTFAPVCWTNIQTAGSGTTSIWNGVTTGTYPTTGTHSGAGMAKFNSYNISDGIAAQLITPALNLPSDLYQVNFWMYRDDAYLTNADLVNVYYNSAPNTTGATLLGTVNRAYSLAPSVTTANQWYQYTYNMPAGSAGNDRYVIFEAVSAYGNNMFVDDVQINVIPSCLVPSAVVASNITTTSADITWSSAAANFKTRYRIVGTTNWTIVPSNTPNVALPGLTSSSNYEVQVIAYCTATDSSDWTASTNFATLCTAFNTPIAQNFDAVVTPALPICWNKVVNSTSTYASVKTVTGSTQTAPNNVKITNYDDATATLILASPEIIPALNSLRVRFNAYGGPGYALSVGTMTDPLNAATYTELQSVAISGTATNYTVSLAAYAGTDRYIAFKHGLGGLYRTISLDDVVIEAIPSCLEPIALTSSNITTNSADIAWTSTAANFKTRYRVIGATNWTNATSNVPSVSLSGLASSSNYEAQVMAICSATDSSAWSNATYFTTLCDVFTVPFLQNFNVLPFTPNCWSMSQDTLNSTIDLSGTTSSWGSDNYLNVTGGQLSARINIYGSSRNSWLITPQINLGTSANQLEFDLAATEYNDITDASGTREDDKFAVVISTDGGITWSQANVIRQWNNTGSTYVYNNINATPQHITIDLSAYSGVVKLAFYGESFVSGNGDNDLFVDNVAVNPIPVPCATPTALAATNVAQTTADLGWTSTAANFNVRYRTVGATTWTAATAATTTLSLTSLTANTQYEFQVQAVCSATAGDTSAWATAVNFTTLATPACATPTALAATNIAQTTADLGWTSTAANFNIRYRIVGGTTWTPATAATTTLSLTSLTANTQYEFQVQAICSTTAGDTSAWATIVNFTTLATCNAPTALVVTAINASGASLNWTAGGTETAWNLRYKRVADATYINVNNTTIKPYILTALQSSTAYVWNVQAVCSSSLTSPWSVDNTFNTTVGISNNSLSGLNVYSVNNQINVINNDNLLVKEVVVYDVIGKEVAKYAINSTDNVLINTNFSVANYIVKVVTDTQVGTYKLFIK